MNLLLGALGSVVLAASPWSVDLKQSELVVKVFKTGAAAGLAHDHAIRAGSFDAQVALDDAGTAESLKLEVKVPVASLICDEDDTRKRHGVTGTVPEGDRKKIRENMLGDEQLQAAKFPTLQFVSSAVSVTDAGAQVKGTFTLHGVSREVTFPASWKRDGSRLRAEAKLKLKTSDFGVKPYSAALGLIQNRDEVELVLTFVFVHAEG